MPGYRGYIIPVQWGQVGLQSDFSQTTEPPISLIQGTDINVRYGAIQRAPGSQRWNAKPPFDATITIASPAVFTSVCHGLSNYQNAPTTTVPFRGDAFTLTTTGALPTGLSVGTTYYVQNVTQDTFQCSTDAAGLSIVNTSGSQSGVMTVVPVGAKLPGKILAFWDWWPDEQTQRTIVVCSDGNVYRFTTPYTYSVVSSSDGLEPTLSAGLYPPVFVQGGAEDATSPRKLFIFTGKNQIQVITGDGTTRRNISGPATEWSSTVTSNYPVGGVISGQSLWVWSIGLNPHLVYESNPNDQEDFTTLGATANVTVYPGQSERISSLFNYKTRLYVLKYPKGLYYIGPTDGPGATPVSYKIGDSFGGIAPTAQAQSLDDMLVSNSAGTVTSLKAVFNLGETEQGDILKILGVSTFVRDNTTQAANLSRQMMYYEDKKQMFISFSSSGNTMDRLLILDFQNTNTTVYWYDKDQPNCLSTLKDYKFVPRPYYGANDGYIYYLDSPDNDVGGNGYTSVAETPHLDFNWVFAGVTNANQEHDKMFDHVGVTYEPRGNWTINCDVLVDGYLKETLTFPMNRQNYMDGQFPLDETTLNGPNTFSQIRPVGASGKRISLRFYTGAADQDFKIVSVVFYFRVGGQNNRSG